MFQVLIFEKYSNCKSIGKKEIVKRLLSRTQKDNKMCKWFCYHEFMILEYLSFSLAHLLDLGKRLMKNIIHFGRKQ